MINLPSRETALALLHEYVKSDSLRKHCLSVEAAMRYQAKLKGEPEDLWGLTGLLHDFDYEKYPDISQEGHPIQGVKILRELGYPEEMLQAILGHSKSTGVARETALAKTLFAVDELSGLVVASTLVRPDKSVLQLEVSSVKKRMKDKAFARGVDREDILLGAKELGVELEGLIDSVIKAQRENAAALGLGGVAV